MASAPTVAGKNITTAATLTLAGKTPRKHSTIASARMGAIATSESIARALTHRPLATAKGRLATDWDSG
eukprot:CAMPEP_0172925122 /NCGR_PEP_ID=MMETSP1075-20121228/213073_1 /TAXON_ID=2916 /ORGANISM="Ceratium fusus, Strain PA161109" /LENGTH=68 /DNA_ID=CAMNT_0013785925 /DNA_START=57 /DNA_END=263 /DNA_ORIENTATION=+